MIRPYEATDIEAVIKIWLEASIIAHSFISNDYWESKVDDMRHIYIPSSTTYIYQDQLSGKVVGFISMLDNFIAAVFVAPEAQGKGIGGDLINHIKSIYQTIELAVYKENTSSVAFYKKRGFVTIREGVEEQTGHAELIMALK